MLFIYLEYTENSKEKEKVVIDTLIQYTDIKTSFDLKIRVSFSSFPFPFPIFFPLSLSFSFSSLPFFLLSIIFLKVPAWLQYRIGLYKLNYNSIAGKSTLLLCLDMLGEKVKFKNYLIHMPKLSFESLENL